MKSVSLRQDHSLVILVHTIEDSGECEWVSGVAVLEVGAIVVEVDTERLASITWVWAVGVGVASSASTNSTRHWVLRHGKGHSGEAEENGGKHHERSRLDEIEMRWSSESL